MNGGLIGIPLGDPSGIGPEVVIKALAALPGEDCIRYLLIGDRNLIGYWNERLDHPLVLRPYSREDSAGRFCFHNPLARPLSEPLLPGSIEAGQAALAWLQYGAELCLKGELAALVTAPVNKEAIIKTGAPFTGQTEFLSGMAGTRETAMMLLGTDDRGRWLRVVLATTHLPIAQVPSRIQPETVERAIRLARVACQKLKLPSARIGVCGLNPHAGEGGHLGREEIETITPVIEKLRRAGYVLEGPLPADTLFYQAYRGDFEIVVAMYHDQGLAPLKMVAFESGINWTLGLPFIRTSPDHGTAYDKAGRGIADPGSMLAAIQLAKQLTFLGD